MSTSPSPYAENYYIFQIGLENSKKQLNDSSVGISN